MTPAGNNTCLKATLLHSRTPKVVHLRDFVEAGVATADADAD
jgi:hypothetical protein